MPKYAKSNALLIVGGEITTTVTLLGTVIAALWFRDDLEDKGIPVGHAFAYCIALSMCFITWGFIRENRRLGGNELSNRIVSVAIESMAALQPITDFLDKNANWDASVRRRWESNLRDKLEEIYQSLASISEQAAERLGKPPKPVPPDEEPPSGAALRSIVLEKTKKLEAIERNPMGN